MPRHNEIKGNDFIFNSKKAFFIIFGNTFQGKIHEDLLTFLLTGGVAIEKPVPNPAPSWLVDKAWSTIVRISALHGYVYL